MKTKIQRLQDFDKWMRKIKNIHYHDNSKAVEAYRRILEYDDNADRLDFSIIESMMNSTAMLIFLKQN